jgi:hypothetical protein
MTTTKTSEVNLECGARHESAHIVIATVEGLRLKPEGLMVDPSGWGLACYHDTPADSDVARERNILAVLAGFAVENRFREERSYPPRDSLDVICNNDNVKARTLLGKLDGNYAVNELRMRKQLDDLIEQHWISIGALASVLLGRDWEPIKPLKSSGKWSNPNETVAKYASGDEVVRILAEIGISAAQDTRPRSRGRQ